MQICFDDIAAGHARIRETAYATPVLKSTTANTRLDASQYFKCENLQRMGTFKSRGAANTLALVSPSERKVGLIACSSRNHAQAIALAAHMEGVPEIVIMPHDAPSIDVQANREYGDEIVFCDPYTESRDLISRHPAEERGLALIPPCDHPHVMAGGGTVAVELIEDAHELDMLLVPVRSGGLLSGCAIAARALIPQCQALQGEPEAGTDGQLSIRTGEVIQIATPNTFADGAQSRRLGTATLPVIRSLADDIVTVHAPSHSRLKDSANYHASHFGLRSSPAHYYERGDSSHALCLTELGFRRAAIQQRERTRSGPIKVSTMGAILRAAGVCPAKVYPTHEGRFDFVIPLFSAENGRLTPVILCDALTKFHTAAITRAAVDAWANPAARTLAVFGTGIQARAYIRALVPHSNFSDRAIDEAEIIMTATRSRPPLFNGRRVKENAFIATIGLSKPVTRELDDATLARARITAVESKEQVRAEAVALLMVARELVNWDYVIEPGTSLAHETRQARPKGDLTISKWLGVGLADIALAELVARKSGR